MLHQHLWEINQDLAQACLDHPFVRGLADGDLNAAVFRRYVAQDAFFLRAFLRAYALAAAKCETLEHTRQFHRFMGGGLEELELHARYAASLAIDLTAVGPLPPVQAYTDFLLRVAWSRGIDEILAAMTPCMRLYAWLGQRLAPRQRADHPYQDWIATYSGAAFEELAAAIERLLDELARDTAEVRDAYRYAMFCEQAFFSAPFHGDLTGWSPSR